MLLRTIIICVLLSTTAIVRAQPKQEYLFYHLGSRNGLLSNEVMDVAQDERGFIWIATLSGLQRYDGRRFLSFQHITGDPATLPSDAVFGMHMDKNGRLWLRCQDNRMGYFSTTDFTFHEVLVRYDETIRRNANARFQVDNDGNLMLVLLGNAILTYNEKANEFDVKYNPFQLPANWIPIGIAQDNNNDYWIACNMGLVKYNVKEKSMSYRGHNVSNDPTIDAFADLQSTNIPFRDRSGRLWLLSWPSGGGPRFFSFDPKTKELINWEPSLSVSLKARYHEIGATVQQRDGTVWLIGAAVFARFNEKKKSFELVENDLRGEFTIRYDGVRNLFEDKEQNLWVCTNKGLYRFNPAGQFFHTILNRRTDSAEVYSSDVSDIAQLKNGDILVSTWGNGVLAYDKDFNPVKRDYIDQSMKLGEGLTWCIHQRPNGDIWRANQDGYLFIYHADKKRTEKIQPAVFKKWTIRQITEDKSGDLWFGTHGGQIVKWDARTDSFTLIQTIADVIYRLYTDSQGDIWAGTRFKGAYRIDSKEGRIVDHFTGDGMEGQRLMRTSASDILQYDDSLVLIASGGLNILNIRTKKIRYISTDHGGLPSNTVSNIIKDGRGNLWLTIENGICSINMKTSIITAYNENDGLPVIEFNAGATCMLDDGRIVFGTTHELITFDPAQVEQLDLTPPKVNITGFLLMNKPLLVDSLMHLRHLSLKPKENSIVIEFSTLTYQNIYGISYKLDGLDKDWIRKAANQNQAVYSFLPPGNYTFKVRCENGDGIYSKEITTLKITVEPPFWQTWWFFCLLGLLVAAIIYWLDKQRINKIVALQKVRSEIAGNLHDEVNTTLNNINLLSEMARIKADKDIDRSKEFIDEISHKSHSMILAMDDILWSIDPQNDSMEKSLLRMTEFADVMKNLYGANIEIALDKRVRTLKLDMKTRHDVFLIFKEALRTIVEYSGGRQTLIHIDLFKNKLSVKLHDPAANLEKNEEAIDKSIKEMNAKASLINADLDVQYDKKGIAIILLVPVK